MSHRDIFQNLRCLIGKITTIVFRFKIENGTGLRKMALKKLDLTA